MSQLLSKVHHVTSIRFAGHFHSQYIHRGGVKDGLQLQVLKRLFNVPKGVGGLFIAHSMCHHR